MENQVHPQITKVEMAIVLMSMIIGIGLLTIPRSLTQELNSADGWISIAVAGIFFIILATFYVFLQRKFPGQTLFQFISQGKGNGVAIILKTLYSIYFICLLALEVRVLAIVVKLYLLDQTPSEVIVAIVLLTTTYSVTKGVKGIIHLCLLFMPIIFIFGLVLLVINIPNINIERILPIMGDGIIPILNGVTEISLSFLGVEIILFMMVYMKQSQIRALPLNISLGIITISYMTLFIFVVSIFGVQATQLITFPTVEAVKEIEIVGGVLERLEALMITIWTMTIFNTMSIAHFLAFHTIKSMFNKIRPVQILSILVFVTFIIAFIPRSISEVFIFGDWVGLVGISLFIVSLLIGYIAVWIRRRRTANNHIKVM